MISIMLADDHSIVRMGFKMILEQQSDFEVVGEASDPNSAFEMAADLRPDVLLTDISMGTEKSGLLLAQRVVEAGLPTKVCVLSMHDEQEYLSQALHLGVLGYVLKSSSDDELFRAVRKAAAGEIFVCEGMMDGFVRNSLASIDPAADSLSPRETEIVVLAVKGYSNSDIAKRLSISVKTVESQKAKIMQKLGLASKPELFDYAVTHGLLR